jgi:hypothetical protein
MNVFWSASLYIATAPFVGTLIFAKRSDDRDDEIDREESARLSLWVQFILTAVTYLFYLCFYAHVRIAGKS